VVGQLMTPKPVSVAPGTPLQEIIETMDERRIRHLPVVDAAGSLIGILSQRDVLACATALRGDEDHAPIAEDLMTRHVDTVRTDCCAGAAARHMLATKRSSLPVLDEHRRLVGILTDADFLRLAAREWPACGCGGVGHP
jgi:CBS domain-containing protein